MSSATCVAARYRHCNEYRLVLLLLAKKFSCWIYKLLRLKRIKKLKAELTRLYPKNLFKFVNCVKSQTETLKKMRRDSIALHYVIFLLWQNRMRYPISRRLMRIEGNVSSTHWPTYYSWPVCFIVAMDGKQAS